MTDVGALFDEAAARLLAEDPALQRGRMMTATGLKTGGKFFAMVVRGELVVKLPAARVDELEASGTGRRFEPGKGRRMKEWIGADAGRRGGVRGLHGRGARLRRAGARPSRVLAAQHRHRRVAARDAADAAAAARARRRRGARWRSPSRCPSAPTSSSCSANGHARSRWKMLPRGIASSSSRSSGVLASRHRLPSGAAQQAVLDRLGQHGVERPQRGGERLARARRAVALEQPRRRVEREQRQRVGRPGRGRGWSGRSASGSRSRTAPATGRRRPRPARTPTRAACRSR